MEIMAEDWVCLQLGTLQYLSKKSFTYEIYAGTSKAAHKVSQQRGAFSIRES